MLIQSGFAWYGDTVTLLFLILKKLKCALCKRKRGKRKKRLTVTGGFSKIPADFVTVSPDNANPAVTRVTGVTLSFAETSPSVTEKGEPSSDEDCGG